MKRKCEHCERAFEEDTLTYRKDEDEYWCDACIDMEAEAAWERQQERDMESPPETSREEQIRTWNEKQWLRR
jgi:hypothetical protein